MVYSRKELVKVIEEHEDSPHSDIDQDEERILKGALSFSNKRVSEVMTPRSDTELVNANELLSQELLNRLTSSGHSRFPVFKDQPDHIIGMLYLRRLAGQDLDNKRVRQFMERHAHFVKGTTRLDDALNDFLQYRRHLFVVTGPSRAVEGVISVEDILEEIVGVEIIDEFDPSPDNPPIGAAIH